MRLRNKKTGKVFDAIIREKGGGNTYSIIVCNIKEYSKPPLARCILGEYDSLAELNEEWEDYKPAEPLIKDEEIISFISLLERFDRKLSKLCGEEEE